MLTLRLRQDITHSNTSAVNNNGVESSQALSSIASSSSPKRSLTPESLPEEGEITSDSPEFIHPLFIDSIARVESVREAVLDVVTSHRRSSEEELDPELAPSLKRAKKVKSQQQEIIARDQISRSAVATCARTRPSLGWESNLSDGEDPPHFFRQFPGHFSRHLSGHLSDPVNSKQSGTLCYSQSGYATYFSDVSHLPTQSRIDRNVEENRRIDGLINSAVDRRSIEELESLYCENEGILNAINVAKIIFQMAKISKSAEEKPSSYLINKFVDRSLDLVNEFDSQALVNMVRAFAYFGIQKADLMQVFANAIEAQIGDFDAQQLVGTAWAFATLGLRNDNLMRVVLEAAEPRFCQFLPQELANMAWAMALLEVKNYAIFRAIAKELNNRLPGEFKSLEVAQFLRAQSAVKLDGVDIDLIPTHWNLPRPVCNHSISVFQVDVGIYLNNLAELVGKELQEETFIPEINHSIDFTIGTLAFEIDGPSHFAFESEQPLGSTLFRNRLLKRLGWDLVCIPYWEWDIADTPENKSSYLNRKIEQVQRK